MIRHFIDGDQCLIGTRHFIDGDQCLIGTRHFIDGVLYKHAVLQVRSLSKPNNSSAQHTQEPYISRVSLTTTGAKKNMTVLTTTDDVHNGLVNHSKVAH
jgi:hypothetical protein